MSQASVIDWGVKASLLALFATGIGLASSALFESQYSIPIFARTQLDAGFGHVVYGGLSLLIARLSIWTLREYQSFDFVADSAVWYGRFYGGRADFSSASRHALTQRFVWSAMRLVTFVLIYVLPAVAFLWLALGTNTGLWLTGLPMLAAMLLPAVVASEFIKTHRRNGGSVGNSFSSPAVHAAHDFGSSLGDKLWLFDLSATAALGLMFGLFLYPYATPSLGGGGQTAVVLSRVVTSEEWLSPMRSGATVWLRRVSPAYAQISDTYRTSLWDPRENVGRVGYLRVGDLPAVTSTASATTPR